MDDNPIYTELTHRHLVDPLPTEQLDWAALIANRVDGWCEDRDPRADWELTNIDGRE